MTEEFADIVSFFILSAFAGPKNVHIVPAASKYVQVHFLIHKILICSFFFLIKNSFFLCLIKSIISLWHLHIGSKLLFIVFCPTINIGKKLTPKLISVSKLFFFLSWKQLYTEKILSLQFLLFWTSLSSAWVHASFKIFFPLAFFHDFYYWLLAYSLLTAI